MFLISENSFTDYVNTFYPINTPYSFIDVCTLAKDKSAELMTGDEIDEVYHKIMDYTYVNEEKIKLALRKYHILPELYWTNSIKLISFFNSQPPSTEVFNFGCLTLDGNPTSKLSRIDHNNIKYFSILKYSGIGQEFHKNIQVVEVKQKFTFF